MNTKRFLCAALGAVCYFAFLQAQVRTEQTFEKGWKFTREDNAEFANSGYNDSKWQNVTVPHDWAIYGPFSINNDKQEMAITQRWTDRGDGTCRTYRRSSVCRNRMVSPEL